MNSDRFKVRAFDTRTGALLLFVFCCAYTWQAFEILQINHTTALFTASSMPRFLGFLGMAVSLHLILFPGASSEYVAPPPLRRWLLMGAFLLLMISYGFALRPLGFMLSTSAFLAAGMYLLGQRSFVAFVSAAVIVPGLFWLLLTQVMGVYFPLWPMAT